MNAFTKIVYDQIDKDFEKLDDMFTGLQPSTEREIMFQITEAMRSIATLARMQHSVPTVQFKRLHPDAKVPEKKMEASCYDLYAVEHKWLQPGERYMAPCGFSMKLPEGYEAQVRPRSGMAYRDGVTVLNTPGTINEDYTGEVKVLLKDMNIAGSPFKISPGDRIAQLYIGKAGETVEWEEVEELPETERGEGGFGHTGR